MYVLPLVIESITALLTAAGLGYMVLALWGARDFVRFLARSRSTLAPTPGVTLLKPLKGVDPRMYAGLESHCRQTYAGPYEIVFGVHSLSDPAVAEVHRLQAAFPHIPIHLIECPLRLGTSGKVSNLVQMLPHAAYEHVIINDSDIFVSPHYLTGVTRFFFTDPENPKPVGMVTAPYLGRTGGANAMETSRNAANAAPYLGRTGPSKGLASQKGNQATTLWARLEALGISTDFMPGVLTARKVEHGIRFGLGSTLAMTRAALAAAGGMDPLVEYLADDYELGKRIAAAGFRVELCGEIVETTVPAYTLRHFWDHQMRWARSTRDSRRLGYVGLGVTYTVPWAILTVLASGGALWSVSLLVFASLARIAVALTIGVGLLRDDQVLRDLWLLPLRDLFGLLFWFWSFAGDTVVWRGTHFHLQNGRIHRV